MKQSFAILVLFVSICALHSETYLERLLKLQKTESPIELYGKVIDQFGEPVKNATIRFHTTGYGFIKPVYKSGIVKVDENGCFEIHREKAGYLYIEDIMAYGYKFEKGDKRNENFYDFRSSRRDRHRPDKENPVLFHLRKKLAKGTCLIDNQKFAVRLRRETEEQWWGWDIAKGWVARSHGVNVNIPFEEQEAPPETIFESDKKYWDIWATWKCDLEKRQWHVTFRTNGENSGIRIRDDFLYEAPEDGYVKSLDVVFPFSGRDQHFPARYFYIRLREPGMYARFEIARYSFADEEELFIECKGVINPYGDRSFEQLMSLTKIPWIKKASYNNPQLAQKIMKSSKLFANSRLEAEKAFCEQRLAPRPPFEEWVKEGLAIY